MSSVSKSSAEETDRGTEPRELGSASRYPPEAFEMVGEGVSYSIRKIHGPETVLHQKLTQFVEQHHLDWEALARLYDNGELPEEVASAIDGIGGKHKLNRHISGRQLCWGLREYALKRWGMMARLVLEHWNIRETMDLGRIVFESIERGQMKKQPGDRIDDFDSVFDFTEAFDTVFRIDPAETTRDVDDGRN
ncbi:MAG: hypothetical protein C4547_01885 [Phycisphaerales bacterium]|nr:MAG: hypothetical protein C4547_01885 [Phycisphaerales bacterium]